MSKRASLFLTVILLLFCLASCRDTGTKSSATTAEVTTGPTITEYVTTESEDTVSETTVPETAAPVTTVSVTTEAPETACPHRYEITASAAPTCFEDGSETHTCVHCGDTYAEILPSSGHSYETAITDATCTADGAKVTVCSRCGESTTEVLPATGHRYETVTIEATCEENGSKVTTCAHCGDSTTEALPALGHDKTTTTILAATCTTQGKKVTTCSRCDYSKTATIQAKGHNPKTNITAATCTEDGLKITTCSRCDYSDTERIPAIGHDYKTTTTAATCTADGKKVTACSRCDDTKTETLPATGHDYKTSITEATCDKDGGTSITCSLCTYSQVEVHPALGHRFSCGICQRCDVAPMLNGIALANYSIVYSDSEPDYNLRAAQYIQSAVKERLGVQLSIVEDDMEESTYEIVVGETSRTVSTTLNVMTNGSKFAFLAKNGKIAMESDYFVIAAAAYYFVETYIPTDFATGTVPEKITIGRPIVEKAKNFIFLIGDGMGNNQTRLFEAFDVPTSGTKAYSDGEDVFYGQYLPYLGWSKTASLDGITDSAAGGTALSTGYKTSNGRVGKNAAGQDLLSLTELAASLGKATAVMSTEASTGATPASFSAHAMNRNDTSDISQTQTALSQTHGTIINCNFNKYSVSDMANIEKKVTDTLDALSADEDGFFLMYEEAHIDKHCHNNDLQNTFYAVMRFNQVIARFMEYAFYHPDTAVIITADHETGGLTKDFTYTSDYHTAVNVPIFAYGYGMDCFSGATIENVQIPIALAHMMGVPDFGDLAYASPYNTK